MKYRSIFLVLLGLFGPLITEAQVWRVQLPFLYGAQGWQTSNWDPATENRFSKVQTLGLFDLALTVKQRFTVDLSYQVETWEFEYISIPDYLEHADINLPERKIVLSNLALGRTVFHSRGYNGFRTGQFKLGLSKNWWFKRWTIDLGARYALYIFPGLSGVSTGMVSQERFYRVDRWSDYGWDAFEFSLRSNWFLSKSVSLGVSFNWLFHRNLGHGILLDRTTGLDVLKDQYMQETKTTEHLFYLGLGLYYSHQIAENKKDRNPLKNSVRHLIYKY